MIFKMKKEGTVVIILNSVNKFLLQLRDNKPGIEFPGKWSLFGGGMETGETPTECIIREIKEEINLQVAQEEIIYFKEYKLENEIIHTFVFKTNLSPSKEIQLNEGQKAELFSRQQLEKLNLPETINKIFEDYFKSFINSK